MAVPLPAHLRGARGAVWCAWAPVHAAPAAKYAVEIVAPRALEKVLQDNLDIVRWSKREDVTPGQVEQLYKTAPDQIAELLATEGYFSAHVEASFERQKQPELIRFVIDPGEPARIASIDLRIVGPVTADTQASKRIAEARAAFTFKVGDTFRQKVWAQGKDAVVHSLARRVYAAARVSSSRVQIDPETHSAQLQLEVDSGPPFTFGALKVKRAQPLCRIGRHQSESDPPGRSLRRRRARSSFSGGCSRPATSPPRS